MTTSTRHQADATAHPICVELAANIQARTSWEQPAQLYYMLTDPDGSVNLRELLPAEFFMIEGARPPEVLAAFAEFWRLTNPLRQRDVPAGFTGLAFFAEAWTVHSENMNDRQLQQLDADAKAHRIAQRDDRIEARVIWGLDRDKAQYWAMQPRGNKAHALRLDTQSPLAVTGTVIDSLTKIIGMITGMEADPNI